MNYKPEKSPFIIELQRNFQEERDFYDFALVRVCPSLLKDLGGRINWVKISSEKSHIYRIAKGKVSKGLTKKAIELDYGSCRELKSNTDYQTDKNGFRPVKLEIRQASCFEIIKAHWKCPNIAYRVPLQLGLLSLFLGLLSLILGGLSLFR